jgi:quinohemoprotein ethanol dehydrogenase
VWHYQTTPGETWDYNSSMDITLADMEVDGKRRPVILHAPKNGFFYVIDRTDGKLLSAEKFGKVTWAERIDLATGRPVETPNARYENGPTQLWPSTMGVHNWQPMSFNAGTGLVYIPTLEMMGYFDDTGVSLADYKVNRTQLNVGLRPMDGGDAPKDAGKSALLAWDPVRQKAVWNVPTPGFWNGGTMTTAGGLVFQGHADGTFNAYDAKDGRKLWSFDAHMGISGAPITFLANGRQYVAVVAGWGGSAPAFFGTLTAQHGWQSRVQPQRLLAFALDGKATLPETPPPTFAKPIEDPGFAIDDDKAGDGKRIFAGRCTVCHGLGAVAAGYAPDLRASPIPLNAKTFADVVQGGLLESRGMPRYPELSDADLEALRHYLRSRARGAR